MRGARVSTSLNLFHGICPPRHNSRATRLGDPVFFSEIFGRTPLCAPSKWCRMATQALPRIPVGHPQGSISCHSRNGRRARMLSYLIKRVRLLCKGALAHHNQGERSSSAPQKSVVCAASVLAKFHRAAEPTTPYTVSIKATTWQRRRCVAETQICGTSGRQTKRASGPVSQPSQRGSEATTWEREFQRTLKRKAQERGNATERPRQLTRHRPRSPHFQFKHANLPRPPWHSKAAHILPRSARLLPHRDGIPAAIETHKQIQSKIPRIVPSRTRTNGIDWRGSSACANLGRSLPMEHAQQRRRRIRWFAPTTKTIQGCAKTAGVRNWGPIPNALGEDLARACTVNPKTWKSSSTSTEHLTRNSLNKNYGSKTRPRTCRPIIK